MIDALVHGFEISCLAIIAIFTIHKMNIPMKWEVWVYRPFAWCDLCIVFWMIYAYLLFLSGWDIKNFLLFRTAIMITVPTMIMWRLLRG